MEEKFDINTLFRVIIPGYVFFLVAYTLRLESLQLDGNINIPLLTLLGLPMGYLIYSLHRSFLYLFGGENKLEKKDFEYIVDQKKIIRRGDEQKNKDNFKKKDFFYYAAAIDYLLLHSDELKEINKHIRFLYTRMHTSSSVGISIILALFFVFLLPCSFSTISQYAFKIWMLLFWITVTLLSFYLSIATVSRILWWRRLVVDNNRESLAKILKG